MQITESETSFKSKDAELKAFIARPDDQDKHAAVIVIHEIFGLNDNIRAITRRLASEGYVALAVDLFSAGSNKAICIAQTMSATFSHDTNNIGTQRLVSAVDFISLQPYVHKNKIGAVGFCLGGNFAIALACEDKRLKTIAPFYGRNPNLRKIENACPVVGSYPELDPTAGHGKRLKQALDTAQIDNDIKIYPRTLHSFMNEDVKLTYNNEAAEDSWSRMLTFFAKYLN
ncbi:MAG TPA: dienelactone hydrolase family protein [Oculatellaceae cyanobacterium]